MVLTTSMLKNKYSGYVNPLDKIKRDVDEGKLYRLTRGIYVTDYNVDPIFLAASILSPSYVSFEYALSYYGLIPEKAVSITSASLGVRKTKVFNNVFGRFSFSDVPEDAFSSGIVIVESGGYVAKIASKEKALCDSLYKWRVVKSVKDLKALLFDDKRIDLDEFTSLDFAELIRLAKLYHRTNLELLIKFVRKEYFHE